MAHPWAFFVCFTNIYIYICICIVIIIMNNLRHEKNRIVFIGCAFWDTFGVLFFTKTIDGYFILSTGPRNYCRGTFDGWLCWADTEAGASIHQPCPQFISGFDPTSEFFFFKNECVSVTVPGTPGTNNPGSGLISFAYFCYLLYIQIYQRAN